MRISYVTLFVGLLLLLVNCVSAQSQLAQKYFNQGTEFAKTENYHNAIKLYQKAQQIEEAENRLKPNRFQGKIRFNIGVCLFKVKEFADAEKELSKAVLYSSNSNLKAIYTLGLIKAELNKLEKAKQIFEKVIQIDSNHGEAWFDLAMILLEEKKFSLAKKAFQNAIRNKSIRSAEARNNIGYILAIHGNLGAAKKEFLRALFESDGKLDVAKQNLEYCRYYKNQSKKLLVAVIKPIKMRTIRNG